jgi:hypothetical protein
MSGTVGGKSIHKDIVTYSVFEQSPSPTPDITKVLTSFIGELKSLVNPLISLLTQVISSLLNKKKMNNNSYTNQSFSIILFNANGLKNHVNEVQTVLYDKRIDITLITETHFTKHSYISIPGYSLFKSNHPDGTAHGGVALIIKSNLKFHSFTCHCPP